MLCHATCYDGPGLEHHGHPKGTLGYMGPRFAQELGPPPTLPRMSISRNMRAVVNILVVHLMQSSISKALPHFLPAVWIHILWWLIFYRDNLKKIILWKPKDCVFCTRDETIQHFLFDCIVAKLIWSHVNNFFDRPIGSNFESLATLWVLGKNLMLLTLFVLQF